MEVIAGLGKPHTTARACVCSKRRMLEFSAKGRLVFTAEKEKKNTCLRKHVFGKARVCEDTLSGQ